MSASENTTAAPPERPVIPAGPGHARVRAWAAVAGVVAALSTLAVAELVSLMLGGIGNPVLAVGSLIIDLVPPGFKTFVIDLFGTADKVALFVALALVVAVFAILTGILELRRTHAGSAVLAAFGLIAVIAAVTRADSSALAALPTVAGVVVGVVVLRLLVARLKAWRDARPRRVGSVLVAGDIERRRFLRMAAAIGFSSVLVGIVARTVSASASAVRDLREMITLPAAADAAPPLTAEQVLEIDGLSTFVTPNAEFYRIDTALQVPSVNAADWSLKIVGLVENEVEITYADLLALPLQERYVTLACVSQDIGGGLIGNALWLGHPIRDLLARAKPTAGADMVLSTSVDGFTASTPLAVLQDEGTDALLAVGMNGAPLPLDHGFPVRMVVPGLYGYVSATKWVTELKVTTFVDDLAYWSTRGWTERGPIKLSSRIDTPRNGFEVQPGTVPIAGIAWAQHTGIRAVDVRIDDGPWQPAQLAAAVSTDTWIQWVYPWEATSGSHRVTVRATDADGLEQTAEIRPPAPDGATGLHSISVRVV